MRGTRWWVVAVSLAVHGALVAGLFLSDPPERPAQRRRPVKVRLATAPKRAPNSVVETPPKLADWRPALPEPDALPTSVLPDTAPKPDAAAEARSPKPEPKRVAAKKAAPPKPRRKRARKETAPPPSKETAQAAAPTPKRPKAKKFRYELPAGPGGAVALPPAAPGEGGHRFGAIDGDPDGSLGERWQPGAADEDREAETAAPAPIVDVVETTTAPKLLSRPSSDDLRRAYPEQARREGREADVHLRVLVNERGAVARVKVTRKAGHGFDEAATKLARQLRFEPGRRGDQRVRVWVSFPFKFRLNEG